MTTMSRLCPPRPDVSVIMPTYNRARWIGRSIASVLSQDSVDLELLIIDDGSTDGTERVVAQFDDCRVHYFRQDNQGVSAARNVGLQRARGQYVAFLDADDVYFDGALRDLASVLDRHSDVGFVSGGWAYLDEREQILRVENPWTSHPEFGLGVWLFSCPVLSCSIMIRRDWVNLVGGFDRRLRRHEDHDLWLRLALAGCGMRWLREVVCGYRVHADQVTRDGVSQAMGLITVLEKLFSQPGLTSEALSRKNEALTMARLRVVAMEYATGQVAEARANLSAALQVDPLLLGERGDTLFKLLMGVAQDSLVDDPINYAERVFANLPVEAQFLKARRREGLAMAAAGQIFSGRATGACHTWRLLMIVAWGNPRWLRNRGILKITARQLFRSRPKAQVRWSPSAQVSGYSGSRKS
jgi:hypothetical protein